MTLEIALLALDIDGVLTDGRVALRAGGDESKGLCFRDLDALTQARAAGLKLALVTGEDCELVDVIAERVKADHLLRGSKNKRAALAELSASTSIPLAAICFVGDADRDALAFDSVGLALAPRDASRLARTRASRVLTSAGGAGAVAEAVELILALRAAESGAAAREQALGRIVEASVRAHQQLLQESLPVLAQVASVFINTLRTGNKILLCGNGGSAADAQHVAAEIVGRFALEREPWPAIALTTDSSILTAVGNDWDFKEIFARQVRALARPGDVVVGISTSGRSPNVARALEAARECGAFTIAFTGRNGGTVTKLCDIAFRAPEAATPRVQELHLLAWHGICEIVEAALVADREQPLAETGS